jgi:hypothetical protein
VEKVLIVYSTMLERGFNNKKITVYSIVVGGCKLYQKSWQLVSDLAIVLVHGWFGCGA